MIGDKCAEPMLDTLLATNQWLEWRANCLFYGIISTIGGGIGSFFSPYYILIPVIVWPAYTIVSLVGYNLKKTVQFRFNRKLPFPARSKTRPIDSPEQFRPISKHFINNAAHIINESHQEDLDALIEEEMLHPFVIGKLLLMKENNDLITYYDMVNALILHSALMPNSGLRDNKPSRNDDEHPQQ